MDKENDEQELIDFCEDFIAQLLDLYMTGKISSDEFIRLSKNKIEFMDSIYEHKRKLNKNENKKNLY